MALGIAVACGPGTDATTSRSPPVNVCPANSCSSYVQAGASPECNGGVCVVSSEFSGLYLVVSLSEDAYFAPGQTFVVSPTPNCPPPKNCIQLPANGVVQGAYLVSPQNQLTLNWDLGNPGVSTALPVHVTYRPLWPMGGPATSAVDADTLNLPLYPLAAYVVVDSSPSSPPGPGQGTSIGFQANLQPALYEATVQPDPPFDAAFPPDVVRVTIAGGNQNDDDALAIDLTTAETDGPSGPAIPVFDLSRIGGLVGWTAYLRDVTSLRRISTLVTLGTSTTSVTLPTNHHPAPLAGSPTGDALENAELVIAPPAGQPLPTYHAGLRGGELPEQETYVTLAPSAKLSGTVTDVDGATPVEADLFFEAQSIDVAGPPVMLNDENFEYTGTASARIDPATGISTYSATLPPGEYQLTVRPLDGSHQVTIETAVTIAPSNPTTAPVLVDKLRQVVGSVSLADGRPLAGGIVEAVPAACASPGSSTSCLPRDSQTTCAADGTFALALDPGTYVLRVQPAEGTGFPWVTQALEVEPSTVTTVPPITVPAPVNASLQIQDPNGNPVVAAIVRAFSVPASGPAVEVGRAITSATGSYELYLAPSSP